jgi:hypothetical protein
MAKTVEVDIKVKGGAQVDDTADKFTSLNRQIKETKIALQQAAEAGDSAKFNKLKSQLDDLEEGLEKTTLKSKQFDDALASLPGPAGAAGGALKQVDGAFKLLIANPIVATIAAIVGVFLLLKRSLESTAEGQETLNRVSSAFSKVLGPILATLEAVAIPIFNGLAAIIEKVAEAFTFFAEKLGISTEKIKEATLSVDKVQQDANKKEEERQKEAQEKRDAADKEREQKAKEAAQRRKQQQDDANKILNEAELSLLDDRNRELKEREQRFEDEKKRLKLAGVKDLSKFEEEYRRDVAAINKKYDDEDAKKEEDRLKKIEDDKKKELDAVKKAEEDRRKLLTEQFNAEKLELDLKRSQGLLDEEQYQLALFEIKKKYAVDATALTQADIEENNRQTEIAKTNAQNLYNDKQELLFAEVLDAQTGRAMTFQEELNFFDKKRALDREGLVASKASGAALLAFDKETAKARTDIERAQQATKLAIVSDALGTIADAVGRESVAGKALAVAQAVINTYVGANKALATYPPPFGAIAAGTVILGGLLNVRKIVSTKIPTPPGSKSAPADSSSSIASSAGGAGAASAAAPPAAQNVAPNLIPVIGQSQASVGSAIANTLNTTFSQNVNRPVQAFVVSGDVSSAQQLERRRNTAAQLGG